MSFSSAAKANPKDQGKIIVGPRTMGLAELTLGGGRQGAWSMEAEEEYLVRVRGRAQDMAKDILARAMEEAEQIRSQARDEGYREGQAQVEAEVVQVKNQAAGECTRILQAIQEQGRSVWQAHRGDLVLLLHIMVEKVIAVELEAHRRESLAGLLDQAVDMIDTKRRMVISVNPRDHALLEELLEQAQGDDLHLGNWKIKDDAQIQEGGLILECDHGMVDNTIASRKASLQDVVAQLTLEENS